MRNIWKAWLLLALPLVLLMAPPVLADDGSSNIVLGQDFVLEAGERLSEDLVILGGRARLEKGSLVDGNVTVIGGDVYLNGVVRGDAVILGGTGSLDADAVIDGDLVALGQVRRHPESRVCGNVIEGAGKGEPFRYLPKLFNGRPGLPTAAPTATEAEHPSVTWLVGLLRRLTVASLMLLVGAILITALPINMERMGRVMVGSWGLCLGVGTLTIVLAVVLLPLLVIICVGIPVAIVLLLALVLASVTGWASAGCVLGHKLFDVLHVEKQTDLVKTVTGTSVILLLSMVSGLGPLIAFLVTAWGVGAVVLTRFGRMSYPQPDPFAKTGPAGATAPSTIEGAPASPATPARPSDTKPLDPSTILGGDPKVGS